MCGHCWRPPVKGLTHCRVCLDANDKCPAIRYANRKSARVCRHHPDRQVANEGGTFCQECVNYHSDRTAKRSAKRKALGVCCYHIDRPVVNEGGIHCQECLDWLSSPENKARRVSGGVRRAR